LWKHKGWQLPAYIQHVANDLIASGHSESQAVQLAVGIIKNWAAGHDGKGGKVSAETQAKAAAALAEWESLKSRANKSKKAKAASDAPEFLAASTLTGVELARPGSWKLSTGPKTFTVEMLKDAAAFYVATGEQGIPVGLGHTDTRFDGDPAFGRISNIRYTEDERGPVLLGDLIDAADWLAAAAPKRWPYRSVEGFVDFQYGDRTYALALTRLALLGATPPAIMDLQTLQDAVAAAAATSGAQWIAATAPEPEPPTVDEAKTAIDERVEQFITEQLNDPPETSSPLLDAPTHPPTQEGAGMDPAKLREAFGLKPDASDDEVMAALAASGLKVAASQPSPQPDPAPQPTGPNQPSPQPDPAPQPQTPGSGKPVAGTVVIDSSQLEEIRAAATRMRVLEERIQRGDRDELITGAIRAGKFPQARRAHWETAYNADPEGTKAVIASMATNLVPIAASGYAGDPDAEFDADYSSLYPPEVKPRG
jgi:hypothetical protein